MKFISSCIFLAFLFSAIFIGSQGNSYGYQIQQLDNNSSISLTCDSESNEKDESEKKYLHHSHFTASTRFANFSIPLYGGAQTSLTPLNFSIRAPPITLYS